MTTRDVYDRHLSHELPATWTQSSATTPQMRLPLPLTASAQDTTTSAPATSGCFRSSARRD